MGVSRTREVKRRKKKELEKTLRWVVYPPTVAGALLFRAVKKNNRRKKK